MIIARGRLLADDSPASLLARSRYARAVSLACDDLQGVASALSELPEASDVEVRRGLVTAFPSGQGDLFQAVSGLASERGWRVSRMQLEAGRLDDVFRRITRGETQEEPA
jgi:ABC-2 type transport system ATP-binding protein